LCWAILWWTLLECCICEVLWWSDGIIICFSLCALFPWLYIWCTCEVFILWCSKCPQRIISWNIGLRFFHVVFMLCHLLYMYVAYDMLLCVDKCIIIGNISELNINYISVVLHNKKFRILICFHSLIFQ